jgi:hypothetical protein
VPCHGYGRWFEGRVHCDEILMEGVVKRMMVVSKEILLVLIFHAREK